MSDAENDVLSEQSADQEIAPVDNSTESDFDWKSTLSDDQRAHGDIKSTESLGDLATRFIDQRAALSRSVMIPSDEAGKEELDKFYTKLESVPGVARIPKTDDKEGWKKLYTRMGVPESADNYNIDDKNLAGTLHRLNLNGGQAEAVARMIGESKKDIKAQMEDDIAEGLGLLKSEWGESNFKHRAQSASLAIRELGGDTMFEMLKDTGLANHPEMLKFAYNVSQKMSEGKLNMGDTTAKHGTSKSEAQQSIDSIYANANDPYHDANHPDHQSRVSTMENYFKIVSA